MDILSPQYDTHAHARTARDTRARVRRASARSFARDTRASSSSRVVVVVVAVPRRDDDARTRVDAR